jgi:hypothetical protein
LYLLFLFTVAGIDHMPASSFHLESLTNLYTMGAIGTILIVVGFIVGNFSGYMLSNKSVMRDSNGAIIKSKEVLYASVIAVSAIMILVGQYIVVAPNSYTNPY